MTKYIKGKDGKFKGSIPNPPGMPSSLTPPPAPPVPAASSDNKIPRGLAEAYREMAAAMLESIPKFTRDDSPDEMLRKLTDFRMSEPNPDYLKPVTNPEPEIRVNIEEPGLGIVYGSKDHKTYRASVILNEETGLFEAEIYNSVFDREVMLEESAFSDETEAREYAKQHLSHHLAVVSKFRHLMNTDRRALQVTLEAELLLDGYLKLTPLEEEDKFRALATGKLPIRDSQFEINYGRGLNTSITVSKPNKNGGITKYDYAANDLDKVIWFGVFVALHEE